MSRLEPGVFGPLEHELEPVARKKNSRSRSRSCLGKKIRSQSRLIKKSQEPEPLKKLPAHQPCGPLPPSPYPLSEFTYI